MKCVASYITPERSAILAKKREDNKNFATESLGVNVGLGTMIDETFEKMENKTIEDAGSTVKFDRNELAKEMCVKCVKISPYEHGVLEYGMPSEEQLKGHVLQALLKTRCDTTGAFYAIYWIELGDQMVIAGHVETEKATKYWKKQGRGDVSFADKCDQRKLYSTSMVGRVWNKKVDEFIPQAQSSSQFTRSDLCKEFDVSAICMTLELGGVLEYGTVEFWGEPPFYPNVPIAELQLAYSKFQAEYLLLWTQGEDDKWYCCSDYVDLEREKYQREMRADEQTFVSLCRNVILGEESKIAKVAQLGYVDVIYDAPTNRNYERKALAKEFGVLTIRFVPCVGCVLEYGTPMKKVLAKRRGKKDKTARGKKKNLERLKKASAAATRGLLSPVIDKAKGIVGEANALEWRRIFIQTHAFAIGKGIEMSRFTKTGDLMTRLLYRLTPEATNLDIETYRNQLLPALRQRLSLLANKNAVYLGLLT